VLTNNEQHEIDKGFTIERFTSGKGVSEESIFFSFGQINSEDIKTVQFATSVNNVDCPGAI
jgi:hypothetical protein